MTEVKEQEIESYVNTAIEVSKLVSSLPSPLDAFVFRQILMNGYAVCAVIPQQEAVQQLIEAACMSFSTSNDPQPFMKLLVNMNDFNSDRFKQVEHCLDEIVDNSMLARQRLAEILNEVKNQESFPQLEQVFSLYRIFSQPVSRAVYVEGLRVPLRKKLTELIQKNPLMAVEPLEDEPNAFKYLGFQTFLLTWCFSSESCKRLDHLFFRWFCKGELLDIILDTMANCQSHFIRQSFMDLLIDWSKNDSRLTSILQQRYDRYLTCSTQLPPHHFESTVNSFSIKQEGKVGALDCIEGLQKGKSYEDALQALYTQLSLLKKIECTSDTFSTAFGGELGFTSKITWKSTQYELASFLYILRCEKMTKEYADRAAKVFCQKNGSEAKGITLLQPKYVDNKLYMRGDYKKLFNDCGFMR